MFGNYPDLKKECIYILTKKMLYTKFTYFGCSNKNVKHSDLRITRN